MKVLISWQKVTKEKNPVPKKALIKMGIRMQNKKDVGFQNREQVRLKLKGWFRKIKIGLKNREKE